MAKRKAVLREHQTRKAGKENAALIEFLIDTAYRKPELEAVMMHTADLAGLPMVREEIMRLRRYAQRRNHGKVA